jgi:hypothetical protein
MANGERQLSSGPENHLPFALCRLRLAILFGLVLSSTAAAPGQEPSRPAQLAEVKLGEACTVEGQVVKSTTGEGLRKITVRLQSLDGGQQIRSAITDASGHFVFTEVAPGQYAMTAEGDGYPQQGYGQRGPRRRMKILKLAPGEHVRGIVIHLQPAGVITGAVSDEDGDPVVNAQVQALRIARQGQHRQLMGTFAAQTNDRGEYRIFGLEPGQYLVLVNYQRQQAVPNEPGDDVYVPTLFPGTPDPSQATPLEVGAGEEISSINVDLKLVHGIRIRGRVLGEGSPLPLHGALQGVYVSAMPRDFGFIGYPLGNYGTNVQDKNGSFEISGVPPGSYFLSANWSDGHRQYYGRLSVDVGSANLDGITLIMGSGIEVRGRFRTDSDARLNFGGLSLWLQPPDASLGAGSAQAQPDGTFVIQNLYDGNYRLHIGGFPEEYYVKSARLGGIDVLEPGLNISHGQAVGQLEITLTLDGGRVDGTVLKDQRPFGDALVVLVPDPPLRSRDDLYSSKRSDSLGRFSMLGLPPGDFKLFAWEPMEGVSYNDPDYIKLYEDHGARVHIDERRQQNVQLELVPAEEEPRE